MEKRGIASFFGHKKVDRDNDVQQTIATKVRTATTMGDDREDHDKMATKVRTATTMDTKGEDRDDDGNKGEDGDHNDDERRGRQPN